MTTSGINDDSKALLESAKEKMAGGFWDDAEDAFNLYLNRVPSSSDALTGRAITRFKLRRFEEAEADFGQARRLDKGNLEAWVGLGLAQVMLEKVYPALETLETLASEHPTFVRGRIQAGLLQLKLCATAKGRRHLEEALASRPNPQERAQIESLLHRERKLDQKRFYRPDFEALRRAKAKAA